MKKILLTRFSVLSFFVMLFASVSYGQINMQAADVVLTAGTDFTPGMVFYDNGGPSGNYTNNFDHTTMLCATADSDLTVTFTEFAFELNCNNCTPWDKVFISGATAGNGLYSSSIADGYTNPSYTIGGVATPSMAMTQDMAFTATAGSCISIRVDTDGSATRPGFAARLDFSTTPPPPAGPVTCAIVCPGDQVYNLTGGDCTVDVPNLVHITGSCPPQLVTKTIPNFVGPYDPSSYLQIAGVSDLPNPFPPATGGWALNTNVIDYSGLPTTLSLTSTDASNNGVFLGTVVRTIEAPIAGTLSFDWSYTSNDSDPFFDRLFVNSVASATINGPNYVPLAAGFGTTTLSGTYSQYVAAGQQIEVGLFTPDAGFGSATAVLSNFSITGQVLTPFTASQTSGPAVGTPAAPGEHTMKFNLLDPMGNAVDSCEYKMTVNAAAANGGQLTCNDGLNISVDETCSVLFDADMFLEGNNYACYENYIINIWVNNDETNQIKNVNGKKIRFAGRAGMHTFEIIDPATGNKCWGKFTIEDKLAPTPECPCSGQNTITSFAGELDAQSAVVDFSSCGVSFWLGTSPVETMEFMVPNEDAGTFEVTLYNSANNDSYLLLYEGEFDSANPCDGLVANNDDGGTGLLSSITATITANQTYTLVMASTSFGVTTVADQYGKFNVAISWAGNDPRCVFKCTELDAVKDNTQYPGIKNSGLNPGIGYRATGSNTGVLNGDNCGATTAVFVDWVDKKDCGTSFIIRKWKFTDAAGNESTCEQTFFFEPIGLNDVVTPTSPLILPCNADLSPEGIYKRTGKYTDAYPTVEGQPLTKKHPICNIFVNYDDIEYEACGGKDCYGSKKVIRRWTLFDWCAQNTRDFAQIIKSIDEEAPTFLLKDTTVSTRPWDCTAWFILPDVWELHDNCDENPTYTVKGPVGVEIHAVRDANGKLVHYKASNVPKGKHKFEYTAKDCCHNARTKEAYVTVVDKVAPVASTKQNVVVSLTPHGPKHENDGQAKLFTHHIDNHSYDVCTDVHLEIRREKAPDCGNLGVRGYNNNNTYNNDGHKDDNPNDTDGGQFVKFCCEDITAINGDANGDGKVDSLDAGYVKVWLRVWDDADMNGKYGTKGDNYNESWAWVKVENKLPPVLVCPPPAEVTCDWPIYMADNWTMLTDSLDMAKVGKATAYGICGNVGLEFRDSKRLNKCGVGKVTRTWRVKGTNITCTQMITIKENDGPVIITPPRKDVYPYDGCTFDKDKVKKGEKPTILTQGPCDVIGESCSVDTFLFEDGHCKKWAVTYKYWNWCTDKLEGEYKVYYYYDDKSKPEIQNCRDTMYGVDENCKAWLTLEKVAIDTGGCADGWLKWQFLMDEWADGTIDKYASSHIPVQFKNDWVQITPASPLWTLLPSRNDWAGVVMIRHISATASGQAVQVNKLHYEGQMSNHKVYWKVTDGCHNYDACHEHIMVVDKKPPTPYCMSLYTALMNTSPNKWVELWANDFDKGAIDNCTPQNWLLFSFGEGKPVIKDTIIVRGGRQYKVNKHVPHYFNEKGFVDFKSDGKTPHHGVVYPKTAKGTITAFEAGITVAGVGVQEWRPKDRSSGARFSEPHFMEGSTEVIRVVVWDEKCNSDYCEVPVSFRQAVSSQGRISGKIATENNEAVDAASVSLVSLQPEYPRAALTGADGTYAFEGNPMNKDYTLAVSKDEAYGRELNTRDLVTIQRHILGKAKFDSPYKVIAADVNEDRSIDGQDLLQIRKLILKLDTKIEGVASWKFVDGSQQFADIHRPWPVNYKVETGEMHKDMKDMNFVAVRTGNVVGSSIVRSATDVVLSTTDRAVEAGEEVSVTFTSNNYADVYGHQFTLEVEGLELNSVEGGAVALDASNVGVLNENLITVVSSGVKGITAGSAEGIYTVNFVATQSGQLSEMMKMTSSVTERMAVVGVELAEADVRLEYRGGVSTGASFALYQNEPNPFKDRTVIGYTTAEAGVAKVTVLDVTGKVIYTSEVESVAGYNTIVLTDKQVSASGVLYYQVESGDDTATMKMISIK